jgi:hypothetical protein
VAHRLVEAVIPEHRESPAGTATARRRGRRAEVGAGSGAPTSVASSFASALRCRRTDLAADRRVAPPSPNEDCGPRDWATRRLS